MPRLVELADRRTWSANLRAAARSAAAWYDPERLWSVPDEPFFDVIGSDLVRVYHCTRLTAREIEDVRTNGLVPLDYDHAMRRIANAVEDGELTADEGALYATSRVAKEPNRRGAIWFIGHRHGLQQTNGVRHLLNIWGGEGINMAWHTRSPESRRLTTVGVPTVVVALVTPSTQMYASPGWMEAAVQQTLRLPRRGLALSTESAVGGASIEAIEHPGSDLWTRYVRWPD